MVPADGRTGRGRGRPRDPTYDRAIREATNDILAEEGYQGLTMLEVARRAGVAKTTIYRRWDTKAEMVLDAVGEGLEILEESGADEWDKPLEALQRLVVQFYARLGARSKGQDEQLPVEPARLLAESEVVDAFRSRFLEPVRRRGATLVERARRGGELGGDVEALELTDMLLAPAMYRAVALGELPDEEAARRVFDTVIG